MVIDIKQHKSQCKNLNFTITQSAMFFTDRVDGRCLSVRLTDGALSADIFPRDYHHFPLADRHTTTTITTATATSRLLPVKWMAVETLQTSNGDDRRQLSTASDVVRNICFLFTFFQGRCCDNNDFWRVKERGRPSI